MTHPVHPTHPNNPPNPGNTKPTSSIGMYIPLLFLLALALIFGNYKQKR